MKLPRFIRDRSGVIIVEIAMALSVIATLSLGGVEIARLVLLNQKLERVAAAVGDLTAQAETLTESDITSVFDSVRSVATPFDFTANGVAIVSAVGAGGTGPTILWQRIGAGTHAGGSRIGTPGGTLALPSGFTVSAGDTVIVAEVNYRYTPWLFRNLTGTTDLYHSAFLRARYGGLTTIN